jgi:hypothetical protein
VTDIIGFAVLALGLLIQKLHTPRAAAPAGLRP